MNWLTYLIECSDGSLYCGITNNIEKRLRVHNKGKASKYTRSRLPVKLVWSAECSSKSSALKLEAWIKKQSRRDKLSIIEGGIHANSTPV